MISSYCLLTWHTPHRFSGFVLGSEISFAASWPFIWWTTIAHDTLAIATGCCVGSRKVMGHTQIMTNLMGHYMGSFSVGLTPFIDRWLIWKMRIQTVKLELIALNLWTEFWITKFQTEGKVLSFLEACFDLILSSLLSMKFKSWEGKLLKIWGSNPALEGQNFFVLFSLYFQILHTNWVSLNLITFWCLV